MCIFRVADLRRVGGMRYNFDSELPTLLDIGQMKEGRIKTKQKKHKQLSIFEPTPIRSVSLS